MGSSHFSVLSSRFVFKFGAGFDVRCSGSPFEVRGSGFGVRSVRTQKSRTQNSELRTELEHEQRTEHLEE